MRMLALLATLTLLHGATGELAYHAIAPGWTAPESSDYDAVVDRKVAHTGHASLLLESTKPNATSFAVRQLIRAGRYRGKRIRLSGWLKPSASGDGTALWLRVDMKDGDYVLDNMLGLGPEQIAEARRNGWTRCDVVADIPADALGIAFGARLQGDGKLWVDDLSISVVPTSVRTTTIERRHYPSAEKAAAIKRLEEEYAHAPEAPVNSGFER